MLIFCGLRVRRWLEVMCNLCKMSPSLEVGPITNDMLTLFEIMVPRVRVVVFLPLTG